MHVICQTPGCENAGLPIEVPDGPPADCGPCGTELVPPTATEEAPDGLDQIADLIERVKALEEATPTT